MFLKRQQFEYLPCVLFYNFNVTITMTRDIKDSDDKSNKNDDDPANSFKTTLHIAGLFYYQPGKVKHDQHLPVSVPNEIRYL